MNSSIASISALVPRVEPMTLTCFQKSLKRSRLSGAPAVNP